jgi:hypothetical protein
MNKQLNNTTGLKVAFLPANNVRGSRYKVTQTNSKKSVLISSSLDCTIMDFVCNVLNKIDSVQSFSQIVDNTQNSYYLFCVDFKENSFPNILEHFKK